MGMVGCGLRGRGIEEDISNVNKRACVLSFLMSE
jgi:hypothetical protein